MVVKYAMYGYQFKLLNPHVKWSDGTGYYVYDIKASFLETLTWYSCMEHGYDITDEFALNIEIGLLDREQLRINKLLIHLEAVANGV